MDSIPQLVNLWRETIFYGVFLMLLCQHLRKIITLTLSNRSKIKAYYSIHNQYICNKSITDQIWINISKMTIEKISFLLPLRWTYHFFYHLSEHSSHILWPLGIRAWITYSIFNLLDPLGRVSLIWASLQDALWRPSQQWYPPDNAGGAAAFPVTWMILISLHYSTKMQWQIVSLQHKKWNRTIKKKS